MALLSLDGRGQEAEVADFPLGSAHSSIRFGTLSASGSRPSGAFLWFLTMAVIDCAACLHAITDPESPVLYDGCFFHPSHLPQEAVASAF
jgi:hypothetical protein